MTSQSESEECYYGVTGVNQGQWFILHFILEIQCHVVIRQSDAIVQLSGMHGKRTFMTPGNRSVSGGSTS